jgi:hypothetical protein
MISALAVGITASMIAITLYHARSGHPIAWKDETLFAVMLDPRDDEPNRGFSRHPEFPPWQLTYQDAHALYASDIPLHTVMMFKASQVVTPRSRRREALRCQDPRHDRGFFSCVRRALSVWFRLLSR